MKKILFGALLFGTLFTACSEDDDYNAGIATPQTSAPTVAQSFGNGSVAEVGVINLAEVTTETVQVADIVAPQPTSETAKLDSMVISFTGEEGGEPILTNIQEDGLIPTTLLTSVVEGFYGKRPTERTIKASLVAYFSDGNESFLINSGDFNVKAIPATPNISENYYLIGGPGEWNNSKDQKFIHSDKDVFEDPIFTYTFKSTGSEMWFAFGDDEAIDAVGEGVWNKLFGTKGASTDLAGSFDYRYNLDGDHSFCVDGSAQFYRITLNMLDYSYEITPLNFAPFIYFIGATDGWTNAEQKLASPNFDGIYTGYLYIADPNGWGNEFKFQRVPGSWDDEINSGTFAGGISGDFEDGGGNIRAIGGEGVYYVEADLASGTLKGTRINNMNLVGDFNGWNAGDDAQQMTWDAENYCYVITGAGVSANGWKFTANNAWDINLGGAIDNLTANGDNLGVVGSTIKLYPTRKTSDNIYCTVE